MSGWQSIFAVLSIVALVIYLGVILKNNPNMLTKDNLSKSFGTMGLVALGLISFVALLIWMTKKH